MSGNVYKDVPVIRLHEGETPPFMLSAMRQCMRVFLTLPPPTAENAIKVQRLLLVNLMANTSWEPPITRAGVLDALVAGVRADLARYDRLLDQVELP